jgi:hypothetical protein
MPVWTTSHLQTVHNGQMHKALKRLAKAETEMNQFALVVRLRK